MQVSEKKAHGAVTAKFAALEFRSASGSAERGRTLFEALLSSWPKRFDLWNQLADLECAFFAAEKAKERGGEADAAAVRDVFERGTRAAGLKARRAKTWFRRWADWEENNGDAKSREGVSLRAKEWAAAAGRDLDTKGARSLSERSAARAMRTEPGF
jgi:rRNA biogenesis protein RRP5